MDLEKFQGLREIARGGMGVVLRGRSPEGRDVAVKLTLQLSAEDLARFEREARLLVKLGEADGFVPLLGSGLHRGRSFLVMPFVTGGTLRERLRRGPFSVESALGLGAALAGALGRAHALGIVHRDLKPENVLFTAEGLPLVADLGLARHFRKDLPGGSQSQSLTRSGVVIGTPGYMAPEQIDDAKLAGPPADVFALGAIIYECLTGERAFQGDNAQARMAEAVLARFTPIRKVRPEVPLWLAQVVESTFKRRPAERYSDGSAFAVALKARRGTTPESKLPLVLVALVLLSIAGVLIAWIVSSGPRSPLPAPSPAPRPESVVTAPPSEPEPPRAAAGSPSELALDLPGLCDSFRETARTRLVAVYGGYEWKNAYPLTRSMTTTRDGKVALTPGLYTLKLWDTSNGREIRNLPGNGEWTWAACFLDDDTRIASAGSDGFLRIWDTATGRPVSSFRVSGETVSLAVSPDGQRVVTGDRSGLLALWRLATGKLLDSAQAGSDGIQSLAYLADGSILSAGDDGTLALRNDADLSKTERTITYQFNARFVAVAPDGHTVALAGGPVPRIYDLRVLGWDARLCEPMGGNLNCVAFSPDGARFAAASDDRTIGIYDLASGKIQRVLVGHLNWVHGVRWLDEARLLSTGWDGTLRVWDTASGAQLSHLTGDYSNASTVAVSPDGRKLLSSGGDMVVHLWDVATGQELALAGSMARVEDVAFVPGTPPRAVSVGFDRAIRLWDLEGGKALTELGRLQSTALACVWPTPDGKGAIVGGDRGALRRYSFDSLGPPDAAAHGHTSLVKTLAPLKGNGEGLRVLSGSDDGSVKLWDFGVQGIDLTPTYSLNAPAGKTVPIADLALTPDEKRLLVAQGTNGVVWDLASRTCVFDLSHPSTVTGLAVSPTNGNLVVTACGDRLIRLWDLAERKCVDTIDLSASGDAGWKIAFSPDGKWFVVATARGQILRFQVKTP